MILLNQMIILFLLHFHGTATGTDKTLLLKRVKGVMDLLYPDPEPAGTTSSLPFLPPLCASVQVSQAVRFLVGRPCALTATLLFLDTETMTWHKTRMWDPHRGGI